MLKLTKTKKILMVLTGIAIYMVAGFMENADARTRGGGRSFKKAPALSQPASKPQPPPGLASPGMGSFGRGLAGGIMGGFLGSMLFGGMAHAGMGGIGGSGIGLFEILLIAGIGYFLFRRFIRPRLAQSYAGAGRIADENTHSHLFSGLGAGAATQAPLAEDPLVTGVREIWTVDYEFDPDVFKETAQDLFFKIQAGWTRRDVAVLKPFVGDQLLGEYERHFADLKARGHINRMENIAVRKVELISAGVQEDEVFVTVRFLANLLDYIVDEHSGAVVAGDPASSVKFEEEWTFAAPKGTRNWKLEGIDA